MQKIKYSYWIHIAGCIFFMAQPIIFSTHPPEEKDFIFSRPTQRDFIANALMILFFYSNYYFVIPHLYFKHKNVLYFLFLLTAFLLITFLPSLLTGSHLQGGGPPPTINGFQSRDADTHDPLISGFYNEISHHIFLYIAIASFSLLLKIQERFLATEKAKHAAQLSSLKAQINPHFLFNTLNSIYALTVKKDDAASGAVINLASLMRYIIKDSTDNKIPLKKELEYIESYIELQKTRLRNTASVAYSREGTAGEKLIAPLILITFIENAFKYGVNPNQDSDIAIYIRLEDAFISMEVNNKIVVIEKSDESMGIGLTNTKNRLRLLYPGKHTLDIKASDHFYSVNLLIQLL